MKKRNTIFGRWIKLSEPSLLQFTYQLVTASIPAIFYVLEPIAAANVITAITKNDFNTAYKWLFLGFLFLFLRNFSWHLNYINAGNLLKRSFLRIQDKIFHKVINSKDISFEENSREKLINILGNDIATVSNLADNIATKISRLIRVIIVLFYIFFANAFIGLFVLVVSVINYYILNYLNYKLAKNSKDTSESKDKFFEKFDEFSRGKDYIKDHNLSSAINLEYRKSNLEYIKLKFQYNLLLSFKENWFFLLWNFFVLVVSLYLVLLISNNDPKITLSLYLIIIPYFVSALDRLNDFFNISSDLKNADVSVERINSILNFEEKDSIEFGNNNSVLDSQNIVFNQVTMPTKIDKDNIHDKLMNANISINSHEITLLYGGKGSGKRTIFFLLRRAIKPESGDILIGDINLFDLSPENYNHNISYLNDESFFFDGSILKNLSYSTSDIEEIYDICKYLDLHDYITSLSNGYDTNLNNFIKKIPEEKVFLIELARCLLNKSNIIVIYQFPSYLSKTAKENIKSLLVKLKENKTIILFANDDECKDISNNIYKFERGKVTKE